MRKFGLICLGIVLWIGFGFEFLGWTAETNPECGRRVEVCFSPEGGCQEEVMREISLASSYIQVAMYYFTSKDMAKALVGARDRGVEVKVLLDTSQGKLDYSQARFLLNKGIPLRFYSGEGKMHQKFCIIDDRLVFSGSFNWTEAADKKNAEDLLKIRDKEMVSAYKERFWQLWKRADLVVK